MGSQGTALLKTLYNKIKNDKMSLILNGYFAVDTYSAKREEGHGVIGSAALGFGEYMLYDALGWKGGLALNMVPMLGSLGAQAFNSASQYARSVDRNRNYRPFMNSTFVDTQQTYTMRQAGMNLAKQSKYNIQQAMLGNEAQMISGA